MKVGLSVGEYCTGAVVQGCAFTLSFHVVCGSRDSSRSLCILPILGTLFRRHGNYEVALETTCRYAVLRGYTTRRVMFRQSHSNQLLFCFDRMKTRNERADVRNNKSTGIEEEGEATCKRSNNIV
jgi:hypothetical protein